MTGCRSSLMNVPTFGEGKSDLLVQLQKEIMEVISRHVAVDQDKVQVKLDRGSGCSMLEIDIEVPGIEQNDKEKKGDAHSV